MGCETCKQGGLDDQHSSFFRTGQTENNSTTLMNHSQRKLWLDHLVAESPSARFWHESRQIYHPCYPQIKKDIARSFSDHSYFANPANLLHFELVLNKFALYFPKVGYTQGLNFLAGYLLLAGFSEKQAFDILVGLAMHDRLLLIGLYEDCFPLNRLYCAVFWALLESRLPKTAMKIRQAEVPDQIWIFQWFISFYLYSFPVEFVKPFFDYVICKKDLAMVCLTLAIVNELKSQINQLVDPDEYDFFEFIGKLKSVDYCQRNLRINRIQNYANSITKFELQNALSSIPASNKNFYHTYWKQGNRQKQLWRMLQSKTACERKSFQMDPKSSQYQRDTEMIQQLERLILRKSRLYYSRSESSFSSAIKASNFTVESKEEEVSTEKVMNATEGESVSRESRNPIHIRKHPTHIGKPTCSSYMKPMNP